MNDTVDTWVPVAPQPTAQATPAAEPAQGNDEWVPIGGAAPAATPMTKLERFGTGVKDPIQGGAQLLTHILPSGVVNAVNEANNWLADAGLPLARLPTYSQGDKDVTLDAQTKAREAEIKAESPEGLDPYRLAGNIASPVNYAIPGGAATGTVAKIAQAGAQGAAAAALQPDAGGNYWQEKGKQIMEGAAAGAGTATLLNAVGKVIAPTFDAAKERLLQAGVRLTPGQLAGGAFKAAEEKATSVPITGDAISAAQRRAIQDFNVATYNHVLAPLGQTYAGRQVGNPGIAKLQSMIGDAYEDVLPKVSFVVDHPFVADINNLTSLVSEMPTDKARQFGAILDNRVFKRLQTTGTMDGRTFQQVGSELSNMSRGLRGSGDLADRQLADALDTVNGALRDGLERQNPAYADDLKAANAAWAAFKRVQAAAINRRTSGGIFTPSDLLAGVKRLDNSPGRGAFARGDALLQDLAQDADTVIGSKYPDSGTAGRAALAGGAAMLAHGVGSPEILAGLGAAALPYTRPATNLLRQYATAAPQTRQSIARGVSAVVPYVAPATGIAAQELQ